MATEEQVQKRFDKVKQLRDEVRLQADLGKMELKDRWEKVETQFQKAQGQLTRLKEKGEANTEQLRQDTLELIDNLRDRLENFGNK